MLGQLVIGLMAGAGYALAAVGISYTFGIARVMNFAFGTLYMLSAFAALALTKAGVPYWLSALGALAVLGVLGVIIARVLVLPLIKVSEGAVMIVTLGASVALTNWAQWQFGGNVNLLQTPLTRVTVEVLGVTVTGQQLLLIFLAPAVTVALVLFMRRTIVGSRIRAVAQRPDLAAMTGVSVNATYLAAIVIGVLLAALVGVVQGPTQVMSVFMGDAMLLKAFAVAALAGMGQLYGALFVGLGMGVLESLSTAYVTAAYTPALIYMLLIVVLIFRPRGLFSATA